MFEFSTTSITIIAVCAIAIIVLLFLYLYIGRKEKAASQAAQMSENDQQAKIPAAEEKSESTEAEAIHPEQTPAEEMEIGAHISQEEELAASVEAALAEKEAALAEKEAALAASAAEKTSESESAPEAEKAAAAESAPAAEKTAEAAPAPALEQPARKAEPDLSAFYQEVDEEDYEQVGTDVADAIALAFEQAIRPDTAADSQSLQQAVNNSEGLSGHIQATAQQSAQGSTQQSATATHYAADQHIRGRIRNEDPTLQEPQTVNEVPVGAERTAAPGSVRKHRSTGR